MGKIIVTRMRCFALSTLRLWEDYFHEYFTLGENDKQPFSAAKKTPPNLKNKEMSNNSSIIVWYMHKVEHRLTTLDLLMIWCGPYKVDFSGLQCRALYRRVGCAATISQLLSISKTQNRCCYSNLGMSTSIMRLQKAECGIRPIGAKVLMIATDDLF